jgi:alkylation response protein AidB-like acyl-CoA dehydrogenase
VTNVLAEPAVWLFREQADAFVREQLLPSVDVWEAAETMPRSAFVAMAEAGLTGHRVAPAFGGAGLSMRHSAALVEVLAENGLMAQMTSLLAQSHTVLPLVAEFGTPEQHERYLRPAVRGELISGIAITEPTGGSDLMGAVATTATRVGSGWLLRGRKMFITNAPVADFLVVLALTEPGRGALGMSLFLLDTTNPGFRLGENLDKMGMRSSPTGLFELDSCLVPGDALLGRLNHGFPDASAKLVNERLLTSVGSLAGARACLRRTVGAGADRALCALFTEVEAGLSYADRLIAAVDAGEQVRQSAAVAKFSMPALYQRVIRRCMEVAGPAAYRDDALLARLYRDARVLSVFAGSSETMREMYAAGLIPRYARSVSDNRQSPSDLEDQYLSRGDRHDQ